jgi:ABC-type phosphate/phosphonate transport system substrate-binding protein
LPGVKSLKPGPLALLLLLAALVVPLLGRAAGDSPKPALEYVRVGYTASLLGGVDLQDAKLAMETWSGELGRLLNLKPHTLIFTNLAELATLLKNQEVDLVVLDSLDYLRLKGQGNLEPVLTGVVNGQVGYEFVLVANRSAGVRQLSQLRGKAINIQGGRGSDAIPRLWLDVLLRERGLAGCGAFFGKVKEVKKSSQAVLPVFFHQADAAVTTRDAYDTLVELNPQVGKSLEIIASSPRYIQALLAVRKTLPEDLKEKIIEASLKLSSYPRGSQILNLFRTGGVTRFNPAYLKNVQELMAKSR